MKRLIDKRNATHKYYKRTGRGDLFDEFYRFTNEVDTRINQERKSHLLQHLSNGLGNNKNIWRKMPNVGLFPERKKEELHGFTPEELSDYFAEISASPLEKIEEAKDILSASE